eukprot:TRINITY_DN1485_c0_g1_i1.p1 TRINITY_DN1485_c0_g1~~TRINITY_DN1485_c0_g1_i1.p1  ORF type:complete len:544 (+),score=92.15 TRINITY_DN1485_c0_g1_i1:30-1634(+)
MATLARFLCLVALIYSTLAASSDQCLPAALELEHEKSHEESLERWIIAFGALCLLATFLIGYALERVHIHWFPEAGVGVVIGIIIGLLVRVGHSEAKVAEMVRFNPDFFFVYLLPPIIFEAGYNMKKAAFFRNMGAICLFAFIGTTISTFVIGGLVRAFGLAGWCHELSTLASMVFGALISATDPVTVLAVFQAMHADLDLYSLVFGESVLNDAVAIVLYRALIGFKCESVTAGSVFLAILSFAGIFLGSVAIGMAVALISAFVLKTAKIYESKDCVVIELVVLCTFPYIAFMTTEALKLSGIVGILFCGIGMANYTSFNLSEDGRVIAKRIFSVLAKLAETFVFLYLGVAMFTLPQDFARIRLILLALLACLVGRFLNIYPLTFLVNLRRTETSVPPKINQKFAFAIWFSGLRGAMAFVIAVTSYSKEDFPDNDDSQTILTVTLFIAVITLFAMGGPIAPLMDKFDLYDKPTPHVSATHKNHPVARGLRNAFTRPEKPRHGEDEGTELEQRFIEEPASPKHISASAIEAEDTL